MPMSWADATAGGAAGSHTSEQFGGSNGIGPEPEPEGLEGIEVGDRVGGSMVVVVATQPKPSPGLNRSSSSNNVAAMVIDAMVVGGALKDIPAATGWLQHRGAAGYRGVDRSDVDGGDTLKPRLKQL